jgi:hypothetical protein
MWQKFLFTIHDSYSTHLGQSNYTTFRPVYSGATVPLLIHLYVTFPKDEFHLISTLGFWIHIEKPIIAKRPSGSRVGGGGGMSAVNTITGRGGGHGGGWGRGWGGAEGAPQEVQGFNGAPRLVKLIRKHCFVVGNSPRSVRGRVYCCGEVITRGNSEA